MEARTPEPQPPSEWLSPGRRSAARRSTTSAHPGVSLEVRLLPPPATWGGGAQRASKCRASLMGPSAGLARPSPNKAADQSR